jgi:hypothetical protein
VGDFNSDGHPDLATVNSTTTTVSILLNNGSGTFAAKVDYATGTGPLDLAVGDLNNDGHPDIAVVNGTANTVSVLLNTTTIAQPTIISASATTFTAGSAGTFTVTATGSPTPTLTRTGALPTGVTFTDNGNSTATLAGTPTVQGVYSLTITAHNTSGTDAVQTFTLTVVAGSLSITVPSTSNLGNITLGTTVSHQLGSVQVIDNRGSATPSWTATVSATTFTSGGATVPLADLQYWSGAASATAGTGTFTPGQTTSAAAQVLSTSRTAFTMTSGNGTNTATWNPTLVVTLPITLVPGTYTGTITHSVA